MAGRFSTAERDHRRRVAEETLEILQQGGYSGEDGWVDLGEAVSAAVQGSYVLYESAPPPQSTSKRCVPSVEVTRETSLEAVYRLAEEAPTVVLNFASAKNPGGGFLSGAQAQEESLARASGLFPCLDRFRDDVYAMNRRDPREGLYSDDMIFSPLVPFFREDRGDLRPRVTRCSVITAPAPNAGVAGNGKAVKKVLEARMDRVLRLAARENAAVLILGAWGCGVFKNDAKEVASLFAAALRKDALQRFQHVIFAIPDEQTCAQFASVLTPGRERVVSVDVDAEPLLLTSFGYDRGRGVPKAAVVFDCRHIKQPLKGPQRQLMGLDARLRKEVMAGEEAQDFLAKILEQTLALKPASVAVGCSQGKHRSVTFCEELAKALQRQGVQALVSHRDQDTWSKKRWTRGYREPEDLED